MLIKVDIHRGNLTIWDNVAGSPGEQALTVDFEEPGNKLDPMFDAIMKGVLDRAYNVLTSDTATVRSSPTYWLLSFADCRKLRQDGQHLPALMSCNIFNLATEFLTGVDTGSCRNGAVG